LDPDPDLQLHHHRAVLRPMSAPVKLQARGLHKSFGEKRVLRGVDLAVAERESLVIIGGSGTGKSVTLKCILGIITPDSGTIMIDGQDTTRLRGRAREAVLRKFGMLFQGSALFDS